MRKWTNRGLLARLDHVLDNPQGCILTLNMKGKKRRNGFITYNCGRRETASPIHIYKIANNWASLPSPSQLYHELLYAWEKYLVNRIGEILNDLGFFFCSTTCNHVLYIWIPRHCQQSCSEKVDFSFSMANRRTCRVGPTLPTFGMVVSYTEA